MTRTSTFWAGATTLPRPATSLETEDDVDSFRFSATARQIYSIETFALGPEVDTQLELYAPRSLGSPWINTLWAESNTYITKDDDGGHEDRASRIVFVPVALSMDGHH